ncbi:hypothetical protein GZL_04336 [Streptomyces sp. 769]|nr:hypothetical protein GZL_04336 [Streptomyces sp. 769]
MWSSEGDGDEPVVEAAGSDLIRSGVRLRPRRAVASSAAAACSASRSVAERP